MEFVTRQWIAGLLAYFEETVQVYRNQRIEPFRSGEVAEFYGLECANNLGIYHDPVEGQADWTIREISDASLQESRSSQRLHASFIEECAINFDAKYPDLSGSLSGTDRNFQKQVEEMSEDLEGLPDSLEAYRDVFALFRLMQVEIWRGVTCIVTPAQILSEANDVISKAFEIFNNQ